MIEQRKHVWIVCHSLIKATWLKHFLKAAQVNRPRIIEGGVTGDRLGAVVLGYTELSLIAW